MKPQKTIWKREPQAWWPELPGRDMPQGWDETYKHHYEDGKHYWLPSIGVKRSMKRLCLKCRRRPIGDRPQQYCSVCANKKKLASERLMNRKSLKFAHSG